MPLDNVESPLMFTVTEKPVFMKAAGRDIEVSGWKSLVRRHPVTGEPHVLHVAKSTYTFPQNKELFGVIDKTVLEMAGDKAEGAKIKDSISYFGAFCRREYLFPKMRTQIMQGRGRDTEIGFRVVASTSFDGSSAIKMLSGCIDYICTNGAIGGEYDQFFRRHTGNQELALNGMEDSLRASIDVFWRQADVFRRWAKKEITNPVAREILAKLGFSDRRADALMMQFDREADARGATVWALYSALTYYASHNHGDLAIRNTNNDNVAATLQKRELEVFRLTNSNEWKALAA